MNRQPLFRRQAWAAVAAALCLVAMVSCGGGDGVVGAGGTGSPLGLAVGTVNGFGSVIVDGVSYDNRAAPVVKEVAPGQFAVDEVKLGDRVGLEYATPGVASLVRVEAALSGAVASLASPGQFAMLGQTVSVNANGAAGPITQFGGGYGQASDVRAGDSIEVHGLVVQTGTSYLIQATRIDKLSAAPAYLRVTGLVSALNNAGPATFSLGALIVSAAGASILPPTTELANGQTVTVLALPAGLTSVGSTAWRLQAAQIRSQQLRGGGLDDSVSGSVSQLDAAAKTLSLGGLRVNYAAATLMPATARLSNEQYVLALGKMALDGSLVASSLTVRDAGSNSEAELRGNISAYDGATRRFSVRDVTVEASGAALEGCPSAGLANGLFVEIEGALSSTGVLARKVKCEDEPADVSVEREGVADRVDIAGMSFSLSLEDGSAIAVQWTAKTYFGGVTPATLAGNAVKVEGTLVDGALTANKVKIRD